ncbi:MAG TPA: 3-oxoacyl-ACP synthase [Myxococcales bacterium]|nr:3-oxoacyl-ACP synthase [Myxococcales bacterium]
MRARIIGTGGYVPERILTNEELGARIDASPEWIVARTGIRERRLAAEGEASSDMAVAAARRALESAGLQPRDLDAIIVATVTGDVPTPATAAFVQAKLGAQRAFAFDLSAACVGAVYALAVADTFIRAGTVKRVLVVGVELLSRSVDWDDRNTCILFGDGAGALVVEATSEPGRGVLSSHLHSDGSLAEILWIPGPGTAAPVSERLIAEKLDKLKMNGREVFKVAVRTLAAAAQEALDANGISVDQIAHVMGHQANLRIIEAVMERVGVPMERCWLNLHKYGNTSAASLPLLLDEASRAGRLQPGDYVLLLAAGAGMAWGSVLLRW